MPMAAEKMRGREGKREGEKDDHAHFSYMYMFYKKSTCTYILCMQRAAVVVTR